MLHPDAPGWIFGIFAQIGDCGNPLIAPRHIRDMAAPRPHAARCRLAAVQIGGSARQFQHVVEDVSRIALAEVVA